MLFAAIGPFCGSTMEGCMIGVHFKKTDEFSTLDYRKKLLKIVWQESKPDMLQMSVG